MNRKCKVRQTGEHLLLAMKWKVSFSILLHSETHHAIIIYHILFNSESAIPVPSSTPVQVLEVNAGSFQLLLCHKSDSQSTSTSSSVFLSPSISRSSSRQTLSNRHSGGREGGPRRLQSRPLRPCGLRRDVKKVSLITAANNGRRKKDGRGSKY